MLAHYEGKIRRKILLSSYPFSRVPSEFIKISMFAT
jgi:hypothetical protein